MSKKVLIIVIIVAILIISGIFYSTTTKNNQSVTIIINSLLHFATALLGYLGSMITIEWREESQYKLEKTQGRRKTADNRRQTDSLPA